MANSSRSPEDVPMRRPATYFFYSFKQIGDSESAKNTESYTMQAVICHWVTISCNKNYHPFHKKS